MTERMQKHWDNRAQADSDADASIRDQNQRDVEIGAIRPYLRAGDLALDVGCANGFTSVRLAESGCRIVGLDITFKMLRRAKRGPVRFVNGDVRELPFSSGSFDACISIRCLINLPSWEMKQHAIDELLRVTKARGRILLLEGLVEGRSALNRLRERVGLDAMPGVPFNSDFEEARLLEFLRGRCEVEEVRKFGVYDLISRVAHPLIAAPEEPRYDSKINQVAAVLAKESSGLDDISRIGLFVLRPRR
jgi:SAM-dependent methyltransferase